MLEVYSHCWVVLHIPVSVWCRCSSGCLSYPCWPCDVWPFPVHCLIGPHQVQPLGNYSFSISSLLILLLPFKARYPTLFSSNSNLFLFWYKTLLSSLLLGPAISVKNFSKSQLLSPISPAINLQCIRRCCSTSSLSPHSKPFLVSFHFASFSLCSVYHKHVSWITA